MKELGQKKSGAPTDELERQDLVPWNSSRGVYRLAALTADNTSPLLPPGELPGPEHELEGDHLGVGGALGEDVLGGSAQTASPGRRDRSWLVASVPLN